MEMEYKLSLPHQTIGKLSIINYFKPCMDMVSKVNLS